MVDEWEYFSYASDAKLACSCCGEKGMDDSFMNKLDAIRNACDFPFYITSGYRCPDYNDRVSGTGRNGPHTTGRAVDIKANSRQRALITKAAHQLGISRVGVDSTFLHIDDLTEEDGFTINVMWTY